MPLPFLPSSALLRNYLKSVSENTSIKWLKLLWSLHPPYRISLHFCFISLSSFLFFLFSLLFFFFFFFPFFPTTFALWKAKIKASSFYTCPENNDSSSCSSFLENGILLSQTVCQEGPSSSLLKTSPRTEKAQVLRNWEGEHREGGWSFER